MPRYLEGIKFSHVDPDDVPSNLIISFDALTSERSLEITAPLIDPSLAKVKVEATAERSA